MASPQNSEAEALTSLKNLVDTGLTEVPEAYIRAENERPTATPIYTENIPVIDLQGLHGPNRPHTVKAISNACQEWGFFQVINHGVPERVIERMAEAHHRFFELPEEEKAKYRTEDQMKPVIYGTSFTAKNQKVLQWRDFLGIVIVAMDAQTLESWPPIILDAALEYVTEVKKLASRLLSALSESLQIPFNLENLMGCNRLLLNYYPPCPNPDMAFGVSGHCDPGLLTVLLQDDVGGLQVLHKDRWVAVEPISNTFVINVGDSLQVLSNGRIQSVEHRAVPSRNRTRISIPIFCDPAFPTEIGPIIDLISEDNPAKYRSFTYGEFVAYFLNKPLSGKADNLTFARLN
uniref:Fe2OG dioxygenase domain-containing protein n=1 Tax=Araucaria cunninghamii TaxID=56994 RepID=A0A0D6QX89_ARACU